MYKTSASQADWSEEEVNIVDGAFNGFDEQGNAVAVIIPSKDVNGNDVTSIGGGIFNLCTKLTNVKIPDSVMSIGEGAFAECTGLTSVTIPDSVMSI